MTHQLTNNVICFAACWMVGWKSAVTGEQAGKVSRGNGLGG